MPYLRDDRPWPYSLASQQPEFLELWAKPEQAQQHSPVEQIERILADLATLKTLFWP